MMLLEYKRVYQGGHHDVWCNGKIHVHTFLGGKCHDDIDKTKHVDIKSVYLCDCDKFNKQ